LAKLSKCVKVKIVASLSLYQNLRESLLKGLRKEIFALECLMEAKYPNCQSPKLN